MCVMEIGTVSLLVSTCDSECETCFAILYRFAITTGFARTTLPGMDLMTCSSSVFGWLRTIARTRVSRCFGTGWRTSTARQTHSEKTSGFQSAIGSETPSVSVMLSEIESHLATAKRLNYLFQSTSLSGTR